MNTIRELSFNNAKYDRMVKEVRDNCNFTPAVVFDVGANVGGVSRALNKHFPDANIYSFEPIKQSYDSLVKNIGNNKQVFTFNFGFWGQEDKVVQFGLPASRNKEILNFGLMTIFGEKIHSQSGELKNFNNWCLTNQIFPDIIKIDAEGCEFEIIENGRQILTKTRLLCVEINPVFPPSRNIHKFLTQELHFKLGRKLDHLNSIYRRG